MPAKKSTSTTKKSKINIDDSELSNISNTKNLSRKDRMHEKVENYVYKNRDKTSQKIIEKKSKRPEKDYQDSDLETMISRICLENNPKSIKKDSHKWILYLLYIIIIIAFLLIIMKWLSWNIPHI